MVKNFMDLSGKVAVVMGGTSGIGAMMALGLAEAGADVVPTGRRKAELDAVCDKVEAVGRKTVRKTCDVQSRESVDGHLYIAALYTEHSLYPDALTTLDEVLVRTNLTYADRVEAFARRGYILIELRRLDEAKVSLDSAIAESHKVTKLGDTYYVAMASYYRGELAHKQFSEAPVRLPDDQLVADLEAKRVLAVKAYDYWKDSLGFRQAYWATASGYQMSQIFVELWRAHVTAPYPERIDAATRPVYNTEVHERVREHLEKALEGHRMNVELAKAYGVETEWSRASAEQAARVMELLAREANGAYITPAN